MLKKKKTLIINIKRSPWSDGHEDFVRCWIQCLRSRVFATYDKKVSSLWVVVDEELPPPGFVRFYLLLYHHTFLCFYVSWIRDKIKWEIRFRSEKDLCFGYTFISKTRGPPSPKKNHSFIFHFFFFWKFWKARISEITLSCEFVYQTNFDGTSNEALILDFVSCNYERRQLIGRLQSLHIYI